jgi:hypothetical protein
MAAVDDRPEPQRVEIELTAHDPSGPTSPGGRDRMEASGGAEVGAPSDGVLAEGVLATERGRLVAAGAFAATIALLLGVLVGRLGSGDVGTTDGAATSSTLSTLSTTDITTTDITRSVGRDGSDTLPPAPEILVPPSTTRPTSTTVATLGDAEHPDRLVEGVIDIDPNVPVSPVEVVAMTNRNEVVRIDVPAGTTVSTLIDGGQYGPPSIHAGDGWILIPSFDERLGSIVIHDDGSRTSLGTGTSWPLMENTVNGTFWRSDGEPTGGVPSRLVEIEVDGSPTGAAVELGGFYPGMIDPRGGVVVQAPGGFYVVTPDSTNMITSGRLLAIGVDRAVVQECDESLACGYFVVDRSTGTRTPLDLAPELAGEGVSIEGGGWWTFSEPLSPTGDAVLVTVWMPDGGGQQSLGVIDLTTGGYESIGGFVDTPAMAWAPDGRSVYWLERGRLTVFDRSTGVSTLFSEDLGTINAFPLRPTTSPVGAAAPTSVPDGDADGG